MKKKYKYGIIYTVGGAYYALIEVLWRGYSHWSMILIGGSCVLCLYIINEKGKRSPLWLKCLEGCGAITAIELVSGIAVNRVLKWDVWDYSDKAIQFLGQISLNTSLLWFFLCIPAFAACKITEEIFSSRE